MNIKIILFILMGVFSSHSFAEERIKSYPNFQIYNTAKNTSLKNGTANITFHFVSDNFYNTPKGYQTIIYYSINEKTDTLFLDSTFTQTIQVKSGKTNFKFWAGPGYNEVIADSIDISNQTTNDAQVNFYSENMVIEVDKPVIYFQSPIKLDFKLAVTPKTEFSFTYPAYKDFWKGTVYPTGEIEIENQTYPYLFWDSKQIFSLKNHSNGYHISKQEVIPFLEKQLSNAGLTSTEKTDFITYWGPRMTQYESVFIQFYTQEDCDQFATLQCEPRPEAINRLYIGFSEWNETLTPFLRPTDLNSFDRSGFNLLEWGGFELITPEL
ncbi:hypothetical protein [Fluviicola taffensis]|uniref:Uncharacterized protein n=1 Tax=Fluviicola taffensis (strain DSM 16823 / NCIMB 13979 / RW262) TaxID=755732 RepID=F2ICK8_FLUTR|nr:hypothetical protein [Fluviicola taffensis]AEA42235.1 hypothetical protein Fluta_0226 [Fluviicola taffensis DSM 16823]